MFASLILSMALGGPYPSIMLGGSPWPSRAVDRIPRQRRVYYYQPTYRYDPWFDDWRIRDDIWRLERRQKMLDQRLLWGR